VVLGGLDFGALLDVDLVHTSRKLMLRMSCQFPILDFIPSLLAPSRRTTITRAVVRVAEAVALHSGQLQIFNQILGEEVTHISFVIGTDKIGAQFMVPTFVVNASLLLSPTEYIAGQLGPGTKSARVDCIVAGLLDGRDGGGEGGCDCEGRNEESLEESHLGIGCVVVMIEGKSCGVERGVK
jgi:hypothetical protein